MRYFTWKLELVSNNLWPIVDYGGVIHDQPNNNGLSEKIESIQYNAALPIIVASKGASKKKLYQELGLESLKDIRWLRRLCYEALSTKLPI